MLFMVSNIRLVAIHVVWLKHVSEHVFIRIILVYSLLSGSGRTDKHEAQKYFMRIGDIKFYSTVSVFYLLKKFLRVNINRYT